MHRQPIYADGTAIQNSISMWESGEPSENSYGVLSSAGVSLDDGLDSLYYVCKMNASEMNISITSITAADVTTIAHSTEDTSTTSFTTMSDTNKPSSTILDSSLESSAVQGSTIQTLVETTSVSQLIETTNISQLIDTTSASQPANEPVQDVFAAVFSAVETNVTSQQGIEGSPEPVEGSVYPERVDTRDDFKAEETVMEILAAMSPSSKIPLGYSSNDVILDCKYAGYDCYLRFD